MNKKIEDAIQEAECILIGTGEEFTPQAPAWEGPDCLEPFYKNRYYAELPEEDENTAGVSEAAGTDWGNVRILL